MNKPKKRRDTVWGIAARMPADQLRTMVAAQYSAANLDRPKLAGQWDVIAGDKGIAALIVFTSEPDDDLARYISKAIKDEVHLLDFDDEGHSIKIFDGDNEKRGRGHPATFLRERGIIAPGWEPRVEPMRSVMVIEGGDPSVVAQKVANKGTIVAAHPRGTLLHGDVTEIGTLLVPRLRPGVVIYSLLYDTRDGRFACYVDRKGQRTSLFETRPSANRESYECVDDILGESTPEGIVRALGVPPELIFGADRRGASGA